MNDKIKKLKDLLFELDSKHNVSVPDTQKNINDIADRIVKLFDIGCVSESYLHINDAARLIKGMPTGQAIHKMKAILSGQPETVVIKGELLISLHNSH